MRIPAHNDAVQVDKEHLDTASGEEKCRFVRMLRKASEVRAPDNDRSTPIARRDRLASRTCLRVARYRPRHAFAFA